MRSLALSLVLVIAAAAGTKHGFDRPVFIFLHHPDLPLSDYAQSNLGIPDPAYARLYLYAAFRYLDGNPFTPAEQKAFLNVFKLRNAGLRAAESGARDWERIRATISIPKPQITETGGQGYVKVRGWQYQRTCAEGAYLQAAATLRDRIRRFGRESQWINFWVAGQDAVFESCYGEFGKTPVAAPAGAPDLVRADRDYQIAALLFYSQRLDEAQAAFERIALDARSPWKIWAPYLIGRIWLWKARLSQDDNAYKPTLEKAEAQFRAVLRDRTLLATHAAAERLLIRCMLITKPAQALERLGARLNSPGAAATRTTDLFTYLGALDAADKAKPAANDPVSLWIRTFQTPLTFAAAYREWKVTKSKAWLYAALTKGSAPDLIAEAQKVAIDSTGGPAIHFQLARQLARSREFAEARGELAELLKRSNDLPSMRNRVLALQAQVSTTLSEFARSAPLSVIMASDEMDVEELQGRDKPDLSLYRGATPAIERQMHKEILKAAAHAASLASRPRLDLPSVTIFNTRLTPAMLREVALDGSALPQHLANELKLAVWTRALLLKRYDIAREFAPHITTLFPKVASRMREFVDAPDEATAEARAAFVLLDLPGARPYLSWGYGRDREVTEHDEWGKNWWYRFVPSDIYGNDLPYWAGEWGRHNTLDADVIPSLPFVSRSDEEQASRELAQLTKTGERGLNWIAIRISAEIAKNRHYPDGPEILYHLIRSAKLIQWGSPPDFEMPQPGLRQAYRLLATRYSRTQWFPKAQEILPFYIKRE